ncbi:MAG: peptidoglycan editing factor PgeF [Clostridiales bacterium]|nr:peptidoglycan editing factor PgeF [Clostridiales bacterium]
MNKLTPVNFEKKEDFLLYKLGKINIVFSTAEKGRSFNRNTEEGVKHLNSIKEEFNLKNIVYLKQVHSNKVYKYENNDINDYEGDGITTNEKDAAIGVFTADCVPIIIVNEEKEAIAAVHSGWRGTFDSIVKRAIENMKESFDIDIKKTKVFIGPHIRQCCYEVSEELKEKFLNKTKIKEEKLFKNRNLSMEECILKDLRELGIEEENIYSFDLCTHCEKDIKLFSYRKSEGTYGRLFSFAFIK